MIIRTANENDKEALFRLWREAFGDSDEVIEHFFETVIELDNTLVAEIDGTPQTDISQEGLMKVEELLGGAPRKELADAYQSAKKKIDDALVLYFPSLFDDVTVREYYDIMKRLTMVTLKMVEGETEELKAERERLRERLVLYHKPKTYTGHDGLEVKHDKEYEAMCISITKETGKDAKLMTVQEFYAAYEYIQEKLRKAQNKAR